MKVEFLLCRDDRTWDTVVVDTPGGLENDELRDWFGQEYLARDGFEDVVLVGIYNVMPEEE